MPDRLLRLSFEDMADHIDTAIAEQARLDELLIADKSSRTRAEFLQQEELLMLLQNLQTFFYPNGVEDLSLLAAKGISDLDDLAEHLDGRGEEIRLRLTRILTLILERLIPLGGLPLDDPRIRWHVPKPQ